MVLRGVRSPNDSQKKPARAEIRRAGNSTREAWKDALGRSRTFNLQIKSLLLCQLSYECKKLDPSYDVPLRCCRIA